MKERTEASIFYKCQTSYPLNFLFSLNFFALSLNHLLKFLIPTPFTVSLNPSFSINFFLYNSLFLSPKIYKGIFLLLSLTFLLILFKVLNCFLALNGIPLALSYMPFSSL